MATTTMRFNNPTLKVALDEASLATTGLAVECQVNSAVLTASQTMTTIPSTGCSGPTQSPSSDSWVLNLVWLDDWDVPAPGGLSLFALTNSGQTVWYELTPNAGDPGVKATGPAYCAAGSFGGTFGDGSAAQSTVTWSCPEAPTITTPAVAAV